VRRAPKGCTARDERQLAADNNLIDYPFVAAAPGYMTMKSNPMKPYKCHVAAVCPGARAGTCDLGRYPETVGCGACPHGAYSDAAGREFVEPLRSAVVSLSVLSFNVDVHRTECLLGQVATKSFVVRHLFAPVAAVYMLIVTVPRRGVRTEVRLIAEVLNVVGSVFQSRSSLWSYRSLRHLFALGALVAGHSPEHVARGVCRSMRPGASAGALGSGQLPERVLGAPAGAVAASRTSNFRPTRI